MTEPRPPGASAVDAVAERLRTDRRRGLSTEEAAARLLTSGRNEIDVAQRVSIVHAIVEAATEPFVILLAVAGGLALALGEVRDGLLILAGLIPIVGADVITTFRSERALESLREAAAPRARVRRDGAAVEVLARVLVPGDVVILRVGDVVPADLRVTEAQALLLDRSILTGESLPEPASADPDPDAAPLAEQRAIAFAGMSVVQGRGEGIVVATGAATELGRIAGGLGPRERGRSPLQRELDRLVRIMLVIAIALVIVTSGAGLLRGASIGEALLAGIAAAIAAIPEEPPVLLAVVLGLGAFRLLRRGVLVRRLNAQETLGAVDLIVSDKTGTLTQNRLALVAVLTPAGPVPPGAAHRSVLLDALRAEEDAWSLSAGHSAGSFTRALLDASAQAPELDRAELLEARGPDDRRPYSQTRRRLADGTIEELAIGAPEAVAALTAGPTELLDSWRELATTSAEAGRRLLLLARRIEDGHWLPRALLAFADQLRPGVAAAARTAAEAGIQTIVVTGDHPSTAVAIARAAELRADRVITGPDLEALTDAELDASIDALDIVARATPEHKLRLVRAARRRGRTVAVTGDGVNDAPALQHADVGVAMGSGTAVAREAADLVLGDDSFATLMDGLREGRRIVANVQKGLVFLTSTHVALLGFILLGTIVGVGQPLLPIQILWLELFIDVTASVAFEREPAEPDVMRRPPRSRTVPLLTRGILLAVAAVGGATAVGALIVLLASGPESDHARWFAFNVLVFGQLVRAYANRSLDQPVRRLRRNGFLALACAIAAAATLAIPHVPALADAFAATPLGLLELAIVALVAVAPAVVSEIARTVRRGIWLA